MLRSELFCHVEYLAGLGHRISGTQNDRLARQYIVERFKAAGLQVRTEPFDFMAYRVNRAVLRISHPSVAEITVAQLHFDPYGCPNLLKGRCVFLPEEQATESQLDAYARKLEEEIDFVVLVLEKPQKFGLHRVAYQFAERPLHAIAAVSSVPEQIQDSMGKILTDVELVIEGQMETRRTANIVGVLPGNNLTEDIIVCAHHDSYSCPGADDNASGISVLIAIANIFGREKRLPRTIRLVAFGAEEWTHLGSRMYVKRHAQELRQTLAVLNLDCVGGEGGAIKAVIAAGIEDVPPGKGQIPDELADKAFNAPEFAGGIGWSLIYYYTKFIPFISYVPTWLRNAVEEAGKELGYPIKAVDHTGSDHNIFALARIPATSIGKGNVPVHTPQDNLSVISEESLEMVTRLSEQILRRLLSVQNSLRSKAPM